MPERFDVIVVGGGTAGCVLAARLSEEPERSVCLVEAGPDYGRYADGRWPSDMLDARKLPMSHLWETEPDDRSASRARILGGCSAHNACLVVWGSREDYDEWGDGWTFAELEPYLRRAEASIGTRADRRDDLSPFHRALLEACPRVGLPPSRISTTSTPPSASPRRPSTRVERFAGTPRSRISTTHGRGRTSRSFPRDSSTASRPPPAEWAESSRTADGSPRTP